VTVRSIPEEAATHGPRLWLVGLLAASAPALLYLAWLENKPSDVWRDEFAVGFRVSILLAIAAIFTVIAVWIAFRRVIVTSQQVASRGIFGEKRMRWDQIREFYYFQGKVRFFLFPIPLPVAFLGATRLSWLIPWVKNFEAGPNSRITSQSRCGTRDREGETSQQEAKLPGLDRANQGTHCSDSFPVHKLPRD